MKVLLALGNKLLSEAFKNLLKKSGFKSHIEVLFPSNFVSCNMWMNYDVIMTDYRSVSKAPKECFECSKVIVMDNGLEKETIAALFITENIKGFINADADINMVLKAIEVVQKGEVWIDNHTINSLLNKSISRNINNPSKLTERESALVKVLKEGYRNKEIANMLSISEQTVKSHLNRIFRKMGVSSRTELLGQLSDNTNI